MKSNNEQKPNIVHRLISSTLKFKREHIDNPSKSSVLEFKYELPNSFLKAVDNARLTAGYDILPRHRHRSVSPTISQQTSSADLLDPRDRTKAKFSRSSSANDLNRVSTKKIQFRRIPRRPTPHHRHHHPTTPIFFAPRPTFPIMMNRNFLMMNRSPRSANILPMRPPIPMQQRAPIFRFRFR